MHCVSSSDLLIMVGGLAMLGLVVCRLVVLLVTLMRLDVYWCKSAMPVQLRPWISLSEDSNRSCDSRFSCRIPRTGKLPHLLQSVLVLLHLLVVVARVRRVVSVRLGRQLALVVPVLLPWILEQYRALAVRVLGRALVRIVPVMGTSLGVVFASCARSPAIFAEIALRGSVVQKTDHRGIDTSWYWCPAHEFVG